MAPCSLLGCVVLSALSHLGVVNGVPSAPSPPTQNSLGALWSWIQQHQTTPTLPSSSLPAPSSSLSLKYVAVGMGTQNYTCSSTTAAPVAAGALANLYNATPLVSAQGILGSMTTDNIACLADQTNNNLGMQQIGIHYFNGGGVPTFDLSRTGRSEVLYAAKIATATPPSNACTGRSGDNPVAWLFLQQDGSGASRGLGAVYRVHTAGGSAVSCSDAVNGWVTRDYAAEYWFYG